MKDDKIILASTLHSFYNGLENIFLAVAKRYDRQAPTGDAWHVELLKQMSQPTTQRQQVISAELAQTLEDYLKFGHFFRHVYLLRLEWHRMKKTVSNLHTVWHQTKAELQAFVSVLDSAQTS